MGSLPRPPRLSEAEIVRRYLGGEGRGTIGLRARVADRVIVEILQAAGVVLRPPAEVYALVSARRRQRRPAWRRDLTGAARRPIQDGQPQ